jgi:hypothetical protein
LLDDWYPKKEMIMELKEAERIVGQLPLWVLKSAMVHLESKGDIFAIGDGGKSHGPLQIQQAMIDDFNNNELPEIRLPEIDEYGWDGFGVNIIASIEDVYDIDRSWEMAWSRLAGWIGRHNQHRKKILEKPREQVGARFNQVLLARLHNGGPSAILDGHPQVAATDGYIVKLAEIAQRICALSGVDLDG